MPTKWPCGNKPMEPCEQPGTEEFVNKLWKHQLKKLIEFQQTNGHFSVPQRNKEHRTLGIWVSRQRSFYKKNRLREDRKTLLDDIGFVWKGDAGSANNFNQYDQLWDQQYEKLVAFQRKNGHCVIPDRYQQDKALGRWVTKQRSYHTTNKKLRPDRKRLLDDIGFAWTDCFLAVRSSTNNDVRGGLVH
jgi:hypothetical protein